MNDPRLLKKISIRKLREYGLEFQQYQAELNKTIDELDIMNSQIVERYQVNRPKILLLHEQLTLRRLTKQLVIASEVLTNNIQEFFTMINTTLTKTSEKDLDKIIETDILIEHEEGRK